MSAYSRVRNTFIAGLVILIPIVLTVNALRWLFLYVDGLAQPLAEARTGRPVPGLGFVITLAVVYLSGILFSSGPLRRVLDLLEEFVTVIPVVGTVYGTTKKVLAGFGKPESGQAFKRFVFAKLPGRTVPGFLTGTFTMAGDDGVDEPYCTVYVPTNHLYVGDVIVLRQEEVIETDLSVEDGVSAILSAGASMPRRVHRRPGGDPG